MQGWCWADTCTDEYAELVPLSKRYKTEEHAQRFSAALLEELQRRCHSGCSAWSEQLACSLCHAVEGFTCAGFLPSSLPPDLKRMYSPSGRVDEQEYHLLCASPQPRGVLLHALKW